MPERIGVPTPELLPPVSAPETCAPVHNQQQQFKALTNPLWEKLQILLEEGSRNLYERGRVLNQLNEIYAEHGVGTFCSRLAAMDIATTTAYRWIDSYRKAEGLPPLGARRFGADEPLSKEETQKATGSGGSGEATRDTRYVLSDRIALSSERKSIWVANVKKVIAGLATRGYTNENGQILDNKHDAVFEAIAIVAENLEAQNGGSL
jgi:hypothetical protein